MARSSCDCLPPDLAEIPVTSRQAGREGGREGGDLRTSPRGSTSTTDPPRHLPNETKRPDAPGGRSTGTTTGRPGAMNARHTTGEQHSPGRRRPCVYVGMEPRLLTTRSRLVLQGLEDLARSPCDCLPLDLAEIPVTSRQERRHLLRRGHDQISPGWKGPCAYVGMEPRLLGAEE